jgi:hypothetical protein
MRRLLTTHEDNQDIHFTIYVDDKLLANLKAAHISGWLDMEICERDCREMSFFYQP